MRKCSGKSKILSIVAQINLLPISRKVLIGMSPFFLYHLLLGISKCMKNLVFEKTWKFVFDKYDEIQKSLKMEFKSLKFGLSSDRNSGYRPNSPKNNQKLQVWRRYPTRNIRQEPISKISFFKVDLKCFPIEQSISRIICSYYYIIIIICS